MFHKLFALLLVLFLSSPVWGREKEAIDSPLANVDIQKGYQAGMGEPVGRVLSVKGKSFISHAGQGKGFWVKVDLPLFKGDTIVTLKEGRLELGLADSSRISMGPEARLAVNEMLYSEKAADRSGFFSLAQGRARFWIKKLIRFRRSEFRVKTKTAIAGVRGSDFIIWAAPGFTEFTTFEDTRLEVLNPSDPGVGPVILRDFQRNRKPLGSPASHPKPVDLETLRGLRKDLPFVTDPPLGRPVRIKRGKGDGAVVIPGEMLVPPSPSFNGDDHRNREPEPLDELRHRTRQEVRDRYEEEIKERQKELLQDVTDEPNMDPDDDDDL